jgi:hypothetical protein
VTPAAAGGRDLDEVYLARNAVEAAAAASLLEGAGLSPSIRDMSVVAYPVSLGPLGEKRIAVPAAEAEAARAALELAAEDGFLEVDGLLPRRA